jgi:hypothetical protein
MDEQVSESGHLLQIPGELRGNNAGLFKKYKTLGIFFRHLAQPLCSYMVAQTEGCFYGNLQSVTGNIFLILILKKDFKG